MKTAFTLRSVAQLTVVIICAVAVKQYYSIASVNDLLWILTPTTLLVELVTGSSFMFESYAGYMIRDHSFLIASSCAGVNFLITAFVLLSFEGLWRNRQQGLKWRFLLFAALQAYAATLFANTVRIAIAMRLRTMDPELIWINPDQLHRFEGILVYFGFLLLLLYVNESIRSDSRKHEPTFLGLMRRYILPLAIYYATTLGVPLANGIYHRQPLTAVFWEHSLFVLLTPLAMLILLRIFRLIRSRLFELRLDPGALTERY